MATKFALCPDGEWRSYTFNDDIAIVEVRGYQVEGKVTEEGGLTRFRQAANHHGAHLMYYPARAD
ncbi:MAG: hypothetical protein ACLPR9_11180 [Acidimicrobiales bacterium]